MGVHGMSDPVIITAIICATVIIVIQEIGKYDE